MQIFSLLSFFAFIVYLTLGIQVYRADKKQSLNKIFLAFMLSLAIWSFGYIFVYYYIHIKAEFWFWNKFSAFGWSIYSGIALHFSLELTGKRRFLNKRWAYPIIYGPGLIALMVELLYFSPSRQSLFANALFSMLHGLYYGICIIVSLFLIWQWGRKSSLRREKKQAQLIVLSGLITFGIGFFIQTVMPLLNMKRIPPSAQLMALIWAGGVWHAITKYKFLNLSQLVSAGDILAQATDLIFLLDTEQKIVKINHQTEKILFYMAHELSGKIFVELTDKNNKLQENFHHLLEKQVESIRLEIGLLAKTRENIPVNFYITVMRDITGDLAGLLLIGQDIRNLKELEYLSYHDSLTGLYNRAFFEQQLLHLENKEKQSVGLILIDIDGLKLINDTFGHAFGDKLIFAGSQAINRAVGAYGIAARVGGDEFAVLLNNTGERELKDIYRNIKKEALAFNEKTKDISLSLSVGFAHHEGVVNIRNLFKEADDNMYREKVFKSNSFHSGVIRTLTETLQARDFITEGHAERLQDIVEVMGKALLMPESSLRDLRLFAQFHDIGKVGVPDRILFKPGTLKPDEKKEMQRHSEIGYRIAMSSTELLPIADWILKHHEWWDGSGYPIGLSGEEIPLACRILAIADAYDAMTNDRPYRQAMSEEIAVRELFDGAGLQFDPNLVEVFLDVFDLAHQNVKVVPG